MTAPFAIRRLNAADPDFGRHLDHLLSWESVSDDSVNQRVLDIIAAVRSRGDAAVVEFTQRFDGLQAASMADLILPRERLELALTRITAAQREALEVAAERVRSYHEKQKQGSWRYTEADGTVLGQQVTPLDRAGLYVPGGKASYPSSVLMNAIPAKVAGVTEVVMVVPTPRGEINEIVLAAACIAGVDRVFTIGGAQAVAALAYGTESVPRVDKIVGPGNIYVATAKRHVFGQVGIDMIAGPSEILVVCDGQTDPDWIAMDLFSQAEHDEDAQSILVSPDAAFLDRVAESIARLLPTMERAEIIRTSLEGRGALIHVADQAQACAVANRIAPEHLELSVADPESWLPEIRHAGAIFMGRYTAEALGDYCAGPNHVLPTSGTARFSSPLGVYDFQKRSSIINCSAQGASVLGRTASVLARGESLTAHARSAEYRILDEKES
ncbi:MULTISPECIES: histidinol dehydrogenase [Pseudomonas aeruginosa group]|uniref:Histidinol dehydrogenase n=1 Tax=Pseudomonas paraeruginosa TaxID=2994495 RepID=A0A2R3IQ40_9PSED|nr:MULTISPECIES: histidinol dehydrogenase [Pseudomonas aeruginosa group]AVK03747.1 histidinol dehydrogenase [Pseudomonas paraeruginosa]AWE94634.1 histidinol dehydrogenase [Pseudomonas paraeruginosa]KAB0745004.1 histidinol dehydrogenase [Pseudomonas aeruginosa]KPD29575.1 histidinol dehydrogenase [Pseudomonas paraeruginosa]KQB28807.1 histidinol dehydrogenase [Pseudomonas paraeruginosa]